MCEPEYTIAKPIAAGHGALRAKASRLGGGLPTAGAAVSGVYDARARSAIATKASSTCSVPASSV